VRQERIEVMLADSSLLAREAVASMLRADPGIHVAAVCDDAASLEAELAERHADVVVCDIRMAPTWTDEGIALARTLRATHPWIGVVILSDHAEADYALALLESGAWGRAYLLKDRLHAPDELADAVRAVANGESVIDPKLVELLVAARGGKRPSRLSTLSPREREILAQIATGKGNGAIADQLSLSKRSVEKHVHAIFRKLKLDEADDVSRRVKAAIIFLGESDSATGQLSP
jgi:DNA-binding NarL/FixJ family response regulator